MARFLTKLVAEHVPPHDWALHEPLVYESDILGTITVPAGYLTDLASVPRLPMAYALFGGTANASAVVHDSLVDDEFIPWRVAADVFAEAMKAEGVAAWRRWPMTWAVRLAGVWR